MSYDTRPDPKAVNSDGQFTTHNAVYPKRVFMSGDHLLFQAYCFFTKDLRAFRVDRVQRLRFGGSRQRTSLLYGIGSFSFAIAVLVLVFAVLILFSPKYRWRQLRESLRDVWTQKR